ncbi:MAG: hypothetical protein FJ363_03680 [Gemmatimonadetes bacterium]|nr:hypothetical protein [Gemmatimonadota bacterium]
MFVELIDRLRCPAEHAETWLVVAADRVEDRDLRAATLGCPECGAEYAMRGGEVWFGARVAATPMPVGEDEAMRLAALLKLEERGLYLLDGGWASFTDALHALLDVAVLLADPPSELREAAEGTLRGVGDRWPLASAAFHGIALDRATPSRTADAVRLLRPGGRLVAPAMATMPAGVRELARDDRHWVAEKAGDVVPLSRARR